jgi:mycofactocin precursor
MTPQEPQQPTAPTTEAEREDAPVEETPTALVESDLLVEDVSIDGMCGVY